MQAIFYIISSPSNSLKIVSKSSVGFNASSKSKILSSVFGTFETFAIFLLTTELISGFCSFGFCKTLPYSSSLIISSIFLSPVFFLAVGLTCIFTIVALVKNMIANNRNITTIIGKFFLALLGTLAMVVVVILGILISNAILVLVSEIFEIGNTTKLSNSIFNACVGDWVNGYSINEINVSTLSVRKIFGDYNTAAFGIWPTSWKNNGMVNPDTFLYLPSMIASIGLMIAMVVAIINLAKRVYEIVLLYIVLPVSMSTIAVDDGARFKIWRETFITKIVLAYGTVFSVNIFILILPFISKMKIPGVSNFANSMFLIFMIIGGALVIPAGQTLFARLFGQADDMHAGGSFLRSAFYGSRFASALTFGTASKIIRGISGMSRRLSKRNENKKKEKQDENDRYVEEKKDEESEDTGGGGE